MNLQYKTEDNTKTTSVIISAIHWKESIKGYAV